MSDQSNHLGQPIGDVVPNWQPPSFPKHCMMKGTYCRLEPLSIERHAESLHEANQEDRDGRSWTYLPYGPFANEGEYVDWMSHTCFKDDPQFYAIVSTTEDRAVGVISHLRITPAKAAIEIGHVHYSPRLQRTAAATEAVYLMMSQAFGLGYRRYEWKCHALNAASRAAARRLGFSFEGIFRQAAVVKGRNRDTAWHATIDAEWPALQAAFTRWLAPSNFDSKGNQRLRLSTLTVDIAQNHPK